MRKMTRARKLLFALAATFLFLLLFEWTLALTGWHRAPSERVYTDIYDAVYELMPNVPLAFGNAPVPGDPTNHAGFRGPEFADEKPAGTYRIIIVGDSTTFGVGVAEPETYARLLEAKLREENGRRIEVLNAGIPGTNIYSHRILLARKLIHYRPDLVVVYVLFNSRPEIESYRAMEKKAARNNYDPLIVAHRVLRGGRIYRFLRRIIKGGERAEIESHFDAIRRHLEEADPRETTWVRQGFREDLLGIIRTTRAHRLSLLMVYHLHRDILRAKVKRRANPDLPASGLETSSDFYLNFTRRLCEHEGIAFLDPSSAFASAAAGDALFLDKVHFSPAGHRLMAEILQKYIRNNSAAPHFPTPAE